MLTLIAVDPGQMCGVATYYDGQFDSIQCDHEEALNELVVPWLDAFPDTRCAVERYTIGQRTVKMSRQPTALHVIGVIQRECKLRSIPFVLRPPSDAKKLGNKQLQRRLGLWSGASDHANDATAHLLLALAVDHRKTFAELVKSGTVTIT